MEILLLVLLGTTGVSASIVSTVCIALNLSESEMVKLENNEGLEY